MVTSRRRNLYSVIPKWFPQTVVEFENFKIVRNLQKTTRFRSACLKFGEVCSQGNRPFLRSKTWCTAQLDGTGSSLALMCKRPLDSSNSWRHNIPYRTPKFVYYCISCFEDWMYAINRMVGPRTIINCLLYFRRRITWSLPNGLKKTYSWKNICLLFSVLLFIGWHLEVTKRPSLTSKAVQHHHFSSDVQSRLMSNMKWSLG